MMQIKALKKKSESSVECRKEKGAEARQKQKKTMSAVSQIIQSTMLSLQRNEELRLSLQPGLFSIKIANTLEEREEVFRLAYQVYLEKGYIQKNARSWMTQSYDTDPETIILAVKDCDRNLAGSVTLVFDQNKSLPAEKIYSEELKALRGEGKKLVEISRLVINPDYRNSKDILILLFNYLCIYIHQIKKWDYQIIEVNPRHKNYYRKLLHFNEIGDLKECPQVSNAPAILLYSPAPHYYQERKTAELPLSAQAKDRSLYVNFLPSEKEEFAVEYLQNQIREITEEEKKYFGLMEQEDCFALS